MQLTAVFKALRYIVLVFLCLTLLFAAPCSCNLLCLGGNQNQGLTSHPIRKHYDENDPASVTMVAATKAHISPVVFRGTLLSVLVQRDGTVRATFSVDQSMKTDFGGERIRSVDAGQLEVVYLQRSMTVDPCAFEVNEQNLKLGAQYVVFGRSRDGTPSSVTATAFPIPYERRTFRAIKKIVCKGCAKPPRIEGLENVRITERRKLRLQCHLSGNPIPWVTWYKDGQPIDGKGRIKVRTKRRTSRLIIRQTRLRDRGVYECRAVNIVQKTPVLSKAIVTVTKRQTTKKPQKPLTTTTTASSLWPIENCPNSDFCLNGGTCIFYSDVKEYVCHCADGFVGLRCDYKDVRASLGGVKILERAHNRLFVTVVVLFIILSCLNWASLVSCWLCCFRRKIHSWKKIQNMTFCLEDTTQEERGEVKVVGNRHVDLSSLFENGEFELRDVRGCVDGVNSVKQVEKEKTEQGGKDLELDLKTTKCNKHFEGGQRRRISVGGQQKFGNNSLSTYSLP